MGGRKRSGLSPSLAAPELGINASPAKQIRHLPSVQEDYTGLLTSPARQMLAPKVLIVSRVLETRHNPNPALPGAGPCKVEGTPPNHCLSLQTSSCITGSERCEKQKVQPSPFLLGPLSSPSTPTSAYAFLPPPQPQCHMNLYSHSEEEEAGPWLTQRPPSPHSSQPPLTAALRCPNL